jgi:hypothetical protein
VVARLLGLAFESGRGHECLFLVSVVCCKVEVSTTGRSPVQRSSIECCVSECYCEVLITMRLGPEGALAP